jgi:hypothetical protein
VLSVEASAGETVPLPSASKRTVTPRCGVPRESETFTDNLPKDPGATTESGAATAASVGLVNCGIAISNRIAMMIRMATVSIIENP